MKLQQRYVELVERLVAAIPRWCGGRDGLPDLRFYNHGKVMVGASLTPETFGLLARSPDAVALLEHLHAAEPGATVFQVSCALGMLGMLEGSETLSGAAIAEKMGGKLVPMSWGSKGRPS